MKTNQDTRRIRSFCVLLSGRTRSADARFSPAVILISTSVILGALATHFWDDDDDDEPCGSGKNKKNPHGKKIRASHTNEPPGKRPGKELVTLLLREE